MILNIDIVKNQFNVIVITFSMHIFIVFI